MEFPEFLIINKNKCELGCYWNGVEKQIPRQNKKFLNYLTSKITNNMERKETEEKISSDVDDQ